MKRRELLRYSSISPLFGLQQVDEILERFFEDLLGETNDVELEQLTEDYFQNLPSGENRVNPEVVEFATDVCLLDEIPEQAFDSAVSEIQSTNRWKTRVGKTIDTMNEYGITSIDLVWINEVWDNVDSAFRYVPLLGSLNELHVCACDLKEAQSPEHVERFYFAVLAFGIEVALFYVGAPFKMAWSSTRFISNRTLLRLYGRGGCGGVCLSLAMSEVHWAIRGQIYDQIEVDNLEYFENKLDQLEKEMENVEWREETPSGQKFDFDLGEEEFDNLNELKTELRNMDPKETCDNTWMPEFLC